MKEYSETTGIIGAGWYGAAIALYLKEKNYTPTLIDQQDDILKGTSGTFSVRLHAGPHYPRSLETRKACHRGFSQLHAYYPEIIHEHEYAIYGLGKIDANGKPPKIDRETFKSVCQEFGDGVEIIPKEWGYKNLLIAFNLKEPSMSVSHKLR